MPGTTSNAAGQNKRGRVFERVAAAMLGLPQRRRLVLRPTGQGIMVSAAPLALETSGAQARYGDFSASGGNSRYGDFSASGANTRYGDSPASDAKTRYGEPSVPADALGDSSPDAAADQRRLQFDGIDTDPAPDAADPTPVDAVCDPNQRLRDADAALVVRPVTDHAMALLMSLQEAGSTGRVDLEVVQDTYHTLLIDRQWQPIRWERVSGELRRMTGSRKLYGPRDEHGYRPPQFEIPDPAADALAEHFAAELERSAPARLSQATERSAPARLSQATERSACSRLSQATERSAPARLSGFDQRAAA